MKFTSRNFFYFTGLLLLAGALNLQAANIFKTVTTTMSASTDWSTTDGGATGVAPSSSSVGEFGATPTSAELATMTLGGATTLAGLQFDATMQGPLTIASGNTLTLSPGTSTVTLEAGCPNVTINCAMAEANNSSTWTVQSAGTTLTVPSPGFGTATWTFAGAGNFNFYPGSIQTGNGTGNILITTTGSFSVNDISKQKSGSTTTTVPTATSPVAASSSGGLVISGSGSTVNISTLELNNGGNGGDSGLVSAGTVTVTNSVLLGNSSSGTRACYFQVSGGSFTAATNTGTQMTIAENKSGVQNTAEFYVSGGSATIGKIVFGAAADTVANSAWLIVDGSAANLFVGSGGISKATTVAGSANIGLTAGYLLAAANWSSSLPMQLAGTASAFNIVAANAVSSGTPYNITLSGVLSGAGSISKSGGGTLTLSGANTYTGTNILNAGTVNLGVAEVSGTSGPLGKPATSAGSIYFNGGTLQYSSANNNDYSARFPTSANQPVSIDVNGRSVTFATALTSSGGSLTLADSTGGGVLTLTAGNTYTGNTTINGGTLNVNGSGSTASGSAVMVGGGLLGGSGTVNGAVTVNTGGIAPGVNGAGILTLGSSLTLGATSTNNFGFTSSSVNAQASVAGTLTLSDTTEFNLYQAGGTVAWSTPGTYNLIQYGSIAAALDSTWTTASSANPHINNPQPHLNYAFGTAGGYLTLTISSSVNNDNWVTGDFTGNWSNPANWTAITGSTPPQNAGDSATFGSDTAQYLVTLDTAETVGNLAFNNSYSTVIVTSGNTLTLDNGGAASQVTVDGGSANVIQTPVALNNNLTATVGGGDQLALSGGLANGVNGAVTLTANGAGTMILPVANTYGPSSPNSVGTTLTGGGTLQVGNNGSLGTGALNVTGSSTLQVGAAGLNLANNVAIGSSVVATVDNNGNNFTLGGIISGNGALTKINNGTLVLGGNNTYSGNTMVSGGVLSISSAANVVDSPTIVLNGGDLLANGSFSVNNNISIGASTAGLIDSDGTLTLNGVIASGGSANNLTVNSLGGTGTVILGATNTFNGTTVISAGTLQLASSNALENSTLNYSSGTLNLGTLTTLNLGGLSGTQNLGLGSAVLLTVGGNNASTTYSGGLSGTSASLTKMGSGTLTLTGPNTYSGSTTVNGGELEISTGGSITTTSLAGQGYLVDGGTLTVSGATTLNDAIALTESSGTVNFASSIGFVNTGDNGCVQITGGSFSAASITLYRTASYSTAPTASTPIAASTQNGLYVNGSTANVTLGSLTIGTGNSSASSRLDAGGLTITNELLISDEGNRWNIFQVNGGNFTNLDTTNGIVLAPNAGGGSDSAELYLSGGTTTANKIAFGAISDTVTGTGWVFVNGGATLYLGSGGIVMSNSHSYSATVELTGGTLGAIADWSSMLPMNLNGGSGVNFTIKAADASSVAHNISLGGVLSGAAGLTKTGNGVLTLGGVNTYSGPTSVSNGTLLVNGSLASSSVVTVTNATIGGTGTIGGATTLQPFSILAAGNGASGTLNFSGALTLDALSTNDFSVTTVGGALNKVAVTGALTPNGSVVSITSGTQLGLGTYTLFTYSGGITGSFNAVPVFDVPPIHAAEAAIVDNGAGQINLVVPNQPPVVANIVTNNVTSGLTWKIAISDLKTAAGWSDPDDDVVTLSSVAALSFGGTNVTSDGTFIYYNGPVTAEDNFTYIVTDPYGATAIGTVYLEAVAGAGGSIQNTITDDSGHPTFSGSGIPGYTYGVESSTTSVNGPWINAGTVTVGSNGSWSFTDANQVNPPLIFYRLYYPYSADNPPQ
jgi:autotransporter-associated beta strand protein